MTAPANGATVGGTVTLPRDRDRQRRRHRRAVPARRRRPRRGGHGGAVRARLEHVRGRRRGALADRDRPRRGRQPHDRADVTVTVVQPGGRPDRARRRVGLRGGGAGRPPTTRRRPTTTARSPAPRGRAQGRFGGALTFDGTNDFVSVPDANSLDLTTAMTLEAWVSPNAVTNWRHGAAARSAPNALGVRALRERRHRTGRARTSRRGGTERETPRPGGARAEHVDAPRRDLRRHHAAALRQRHAGRDDRGGRRRSTPRPLPLKIGGNAVWGEWFDGRIDEVRVYRRALSAAEIAGRHEQRRSTRARRRRRARRSRASSRSRRRGRSSRCTSR